MPETVRSAAWPTGEAGRPVVALAELRAAWPTGEAGRPVVARTSGPTRPVAQPAVGASARQTSPMEAELGAESEAPRRGRRAPVPAIRPRPGSRHRRRVPAPAASAPSILMAPARSVRAVPWALAASAPSILMPARAAQAERSVRGRPGVRVGRPAPPRQTRGHSRYRTSARQKQAGFRSWDRTRIQSSSRVSLSIHMTAQ